MASAKRTIDPTVIRNWVEARGGRPAHVKRTADGGPGVLRIDFPGFSGEDTLEELSWDEWLQAFEQNQLAFLYQDQGESRFSKLVRRTAEEDEAAAADGRDRLWQARTESITLENATCEELEAVWGIGPRNAERILAYQRAHGPIRSRSDLRAIDGIDEATAELVAREFSLRDDSGRYSR